MGVRRRPRGKMRGRPGLGAPRGGAPRATPRPSPEEPADAEEPEDESEGEDPRPGSSPESLSELVRLVGKELGAAAREGRHYDERFIRQARTVVSGSLIFRAEVDELLRRYQKARVLKVKTDAAAEVKKAREMAEKVQPSGGPLRAVPAGRVATGKGIH